MSDLMLHCETIQWSVALICAIAASSGNLTSLHSLTQENLNRKSKIYKFKSLPPVAYGYCIKTVTLDNLRLRFHKINPFKFRIDCN